MRLNTAPVITWFRSLWLTVCWKRGHRLVFGANAYCTTCHPERWARRNLEVKP